MKIEWRISIASSRTWRSAHSANAIQGKVVGLPSIVPRCRNSSNLAATSCRSVTSVSAVAKTPSYGRALSVKYRIAFSKQRCKPVARVACGRRRTTLRVGECELVRHAPPVHDVRMVDDKRHQPGCGRVAESEIAPVFGSQPCCVRIAGPGEVVDEVEHVLAQHERRAELGVIRTPEGMIGLIAGERTGAELTIADEGRGSQDVADRSDQVGVRLAAGRQTFHHVLEQAAAAVAACIDERVVVGIAGALLGDFAAQVRFPLGGPFALAQHAHGVPALREVSIRLQRFRQLGRDEEEVEHPAASDEAIEHFTAAFVVQIEPRFLDLPAPAHQLAHGSARKAQGVGDGRGGALRTHDQRCGAKTGHRRIVLLRWPVRRHSVTRHLQRSSGSHRRRATGARGCRRRCSAAVSDRHRPIVCADRASP